MLEASMHMLRGMDLRREMTQALKGSNDGQSLMSMRTPRAGSFRRTPVNHGGSMRWRADYGETYVGALAREQWWLVEGIGIVSKPQRQAQIRPC
jgi:hypothetical protein